MAICNYNIHVTDPTVVPVVTTSDMKYHQERKLTHLRELFFSLFGVSSNRNLYKDQDLSVLLN